MPSENYGGDFETTAIPSYRETGGRHASGDGLSSLSGDSLLNDPEPLPYVAPSADVMAFGADDGHDGHLEEYRELPEHRRGTQDLGLFLLRAGFGALLIAHGLQKIFGWWGGPGLDAFQGTVAGFGYQHADLLAYVAAGTQLIAGVLLVLGLFTPLAAAAALAYLINVLLADVSQSDSHRVLFFLPDGHEYELTLIVVATALILVGPGRYGFDAGRGWARRPFIGSFVALLLGIGGGIAIWAFLNGVNPLA